MPVIHLRVEGRVQGVGFRWFVREKAASLGIAGWVRNADTGDVEVAAAGDAVQLEAFIVIVSQGPVGARVDAVHHLPAPERAQYPSPFRIAP